MAPIRFQLLAPVVLACLMAPTLTRVRELAPAYDMVPMLYMPQHSHLPPMSFEPPTPSVRLAAAWTPACMAAQELWRELANHPLTSREFASIARDNADAVADVAQLTERLPRR